MKQLKVAAQLMTWMSRFGTDMNGVLDEVASLGFDGVEITAMSRMLPKFPANKISELLDTRRLKLPAIYSGSDWGEGPQVKEELDLLHKTGGQFFVVGGPHDFKAYTKDIYKKNAQTASRIGKKLRGTGIKLCYHPHAIDLVNNMQIFLKESDPEDVSIAMDTTWFTKGGWSPAKFLKEHGERVPYIHLKDYKGEIDAKEAFKATWDMIPKMIRDAVSSGELSKLPVFVPVGEGEMKFEPIMEEIKKRPNIDWVAVEQDRAFWGSPKDNMEVSRQNLKTKFGI